MLTHVPKELFPHVLTFCRTISNELPLYLDITPAPGATLNECVQNVRDHIASHGGSEVLGWKIAEWTGVMIEAEFHVIWRDPHAILHDISPSQLESKRTLFLPDSALVYEGRQINNHRHALIEDARLDEFISLANRRFEILNAGYRADQYQVLLSSSEEQEIDALTFRSYSLMQRIANTTPGANDLCRCGSGKKYKKCHRP